MYTCTPTENETKPATSQLYLKPMKQKIVTLEKKAGYSWDHRKRQNNNTSTFSGRASILGSTIHSPLPPSARCSPLNAMAGVSSGSHSLHTWLKSSPVLVSARAACSWPEATWNGSLRATTTSANDTWWTWDPCESAWWSNALAVVFGSLKARI